MWKKAKKYIWKKAKKNIWGKVIKNIWRKAKNIWINIEGNQNYLKESKKKLQQSKNLWRKAKLSEGKQKHLKESKAIFNRILTPQGDRS